METWTASVARRTTAVAVVLHLSGVAVLVVAGMRSGAPPGVDPLRPIPIAVLYAVPASLAVLGLRGRSPLLLVAGISSFVLALLPFSFHSFVLGPVGLVYAISSWPLRGASGSPSRTLAAAVICPLLLVGALAALFIVDASACYSRLDSGEVIIDRSVDRPMSGVQTIEDGSGVASGGCSSGIVTAWEALASLALSGTAMLAAFVFVPPSARPTEPVRTGGVD